MRPARKQFGEAVWRMAAVIPFFPQGKLAIEIVQREVESFVSTAEQLDWLTQTACRVMTNFTLPELRGIFCSRYAPADGFYTTATTPGCTPVEVMEAKERQWREQEALEDTRKKAEWEAEAKLLGTAPDFEPLRMLPAPKPMDMPKRERKAAGLEEKLGEAKGVALRRDPEESIRMVEELRRKLHL